MKPISILPMLNSLAMTGATVEMFARSRKVTRHIRLIEHSTSQRFVPVRFVSTVTTFPHFGPAFAGPALNVLGRWIEPVERARMAGCDGRPGVEIPARFRDRCGFRTTASTD